MAGTRDGEGRNDLEAVNYFEVRAQRMFAGYETHDEPGLQEAVRGAFNAGRQEIVEMELGSEVDADSVISESEATEVAIELAESVVQEESGFQTDDPALAKLRQANEAAAKLKQANEDDAKKQSGFETHDQLSGSGKTQEGEDEKKEDKIDPKDYQGDAEEVKFEGNIIEIFEMIFAGYFGKRLGEAVESWQKNKMGIPQDLNMKKVLSEWSQTMGKCITKAAMEKKAFEDDPENKGKPWPEGSVKDASRKLFKGEHKKWLKENGYNREESQDTPGGDKKPDENTAANDKKDTPTVPPAKPSLEMDDFNKALFRMKTKDNGASRVTVGEAKEFIKLAEDKIETSGGAARGGNDDLKEALKNWGQRLDIRDDNEQISSEERRDLKQLASDLGEKFGQEPTADTSTAGRTRQAQQDLDQEQQENRSPRMN